MLRINTYVKAKSVDEAYELLQKNRKNRIVGGMLWMRLQDVQIPTAIDLSDCGLDQVEVADGEVKIGAMVTLRELETNLVIAGLYNGIISKSVKDIVGVQFRNLATIGGSIYSRFGFSDILTALLCLPTDVVLHRGGRMPLWKFVSQPRLQKDILTHIIIKHKEGTACYLTERKSATDFPLLSVAVSRTADSWRIAIGARPSRARLLKVSAPLAFTEKDMEAVKKQILAEFTFGSNMRASKEYRELLAVTLVERAMKAIKEEGKC